ncbi:M24 family metallopeptidase [Nonomuraea roseoviolacea]|uniref:Xaa-Pro aminopeptidase n=1 Tax=Nonomuraea roseoviolacea subsp. carminata TaxID=160689 RepID=A0ABT1JZW9_9ACTN|nr:M24 family metallopeptidase [Nonomuraea roseoviolacea]MCP2347296.1 Xaa-Pro aminopeptidase [Nonomuraea roseoviolacea subsp. carminata]
MDLPTYSLAERDRRWDLARRLMDAEAVDALVVHGGHEDGGPAEWAPDVYFTNDRPGAIVVFPRGDEPIALVRSPAHICDHLDASAGGAAAWIRPENMLVARHAHGVVEVLRAHRLGNAAIGVLGLEPCPPFHAGPLMPYTLWSSVLRQLPRLTCKPVEAGFVARTLVQSAEQLAVVGRAAAIGEATAQAMLRAVRPGVTEASVYAAGMAECLRQGAVAPGMSIASGKEFVACGPPAWSYRPQAPRVIEEGDLVLAEIRCSYGMRESRQRVAIAVGDIHPELESAAEAARASYEAGLAALRPGRTFGEVVTAMRRPLHETGAWHAHPLAYALNPCAAVCGAGAGLGALPETARYGLLAEQPTIGSDLPLRPGMTFALTPNCAYGRRPAGVGGTVVVGEDTPIELNTVTTHLMRSH